MKIIEPSYEILKCPDGEECLAFLEKCARTCYRSFDKIDDGKRPCPSCGYEPFFPECEICGGRGFVQIQEPSSHKLIRSIIKRGHESVIEHMGITVKFIVDRGILAELTRHRLASYSVESSRYCRYDGEKEGKDLVFIRPFFFNPCENNCGTCLECRKFKSWEFAINTAAAEYNALLYRGAKPEEARSVLPNSLKTEIITSANLRQWRLMLKQRTSKAAHPQFRQVAVPLLAELKNRIPVIFDDIVAN